MEASWCWVCQCAVSLCPKCGHWSCSFIGCDECPDERFSPEEERRLLVEATTQLLNNFDERIRTPISFSSMTAYAKYDRILKWHRYVRHLSYDEDTEISNAHDLVLITGDFTV